MRRTMGLVSVLSMTLGFGWVACSSNGDGVSQKHDGSADIKTSGGGSTGSGGAVGSGSSVRRR